MAVSVQLPCVPDRPEPVVAYASLVASGAAARLWQGSSQGVDALHGFAAAAGRGVRVPTGVGVSLVPLRHPFDAAHQARSLTLVTGHPTVAAFGPGSPELQAALLGRPYARPLDACREYLDVVRALLRGEPVDMHGRYVTCTAQMPVVESPPVELGLGVLRPRMARLAGEVADVVVLWLAAPAYVAEVLVPALREGADAAGRAVPRVVCVAPAGVAHDAGEAGELLLAGHGVHLGLPSYRAGLVAVGAVPEDADAATTARGAVDAGVMLHGGPDELVAQAEAYRAAGVDELVVNATAVTAVRGPRAAWHETRQVLEAVGR
jgi:alkanesulfonate monooxygenase SsuD/methylene tetrahydromethanopterin reductase-like flavin-dependent oxidoreductase (luciferase family)